MTDDAVLLGRCLPQSLGPEGAIREERIIQPHWECVRTFSRANSPLQHGIEIEKMPRIRSSNLTLTLFVGVSSEFVVLERDSPLPAFSRLGPPAEDDILTLRLALPSRSIPDLHDVVYEISTPGNIRYGQYLTQDEVGLIPIVPIDCVPHWVPQIAQFVAPTTNTVSRVTSWLSSNNLTATPITRAGEWIAVNMTVSQANALLAANFSTFQNDGTNQTVVRTLSYSIPSALETSVDWVHPTTSFPKAMSSAQPAFVNKTSTPTSARGPTSSMSISHDCRIKSSWTPRCLQELYGIPSTAAKQTANVFGVSALTPNIFLVMSVDGGINNQLPAGAGLFVAQDIQYAIGLTTGVPVTSFPQAHNRVVGSSELPVVIGTSASNRTQQCGGDGEVTPQIAKSQGKNGLKNIQFFVCRDGNSTKRCAFMARFN
ncbi:hypothetical protein B0H13DRAFT_2282079 [Mycena leptocephala]|nr:hypothetical protein B0H13DRAFT_2282079 [Mycena leptocephala]